MTDRDPVVEEFINQPRAEFVQGPRRSAVEGVEKALARAEEIEKGWASSNPSGMVTKRGAESVVLWNFGVGSAELKPPHTAGLEALFRDWRVIRLHADSTVLVDGHASSSGTVTENVALSAKRAEVVTQYLVQLGVERARIRSLHLGSAQPWMPNLTGESMAHNRRVEVRVARGVVTPVAPPVLRQPAQVDPVWPGTLAWTEVVPNVAFESKIQEPIGDRTIWDGRLRIALSIEARLRITLSTQTRESVKLGLRDNRWDVEIKRRVTDLVSLKGTYAAGDRSQVAEGKLAVEFGGRDFRIEVEAKTPDADLAFASVNFTGPGYKFPQEYDLGDGGKAILEVLEPKIKVGLGPGPRWMEDARRVLVRARTVGGPYVVVAILGVGAATAEIVALVEMIEKSKAKGLEHKRKVAFRAGYAHRVASELTGHLAEGIAGAEGWLGDLTDAAWQGWNLAGDAVAVLGSDRRAILDALRAQYGSDPKKIAEAVQVRIGGNSDDNNRPPSDLRVLLK